MRFPSLKLQIRTVSALIVLLFAAEQIVWAVPNHPAGGYDFSSAKIFTSPEIFTAGTGIGSDTARIEETYKGSGDIRIHLIQDAHTNASAQFNISVIIDRLLKERKLETVYLEAGEGDVSLNALKTGTEKTRRISVGEKYVRKGFMQGAEFANLTSDLDFSLWGVEDQRLYEDALNEYRQISEGREKALQYLASADSLMNSVRHEVLSKPASDLYDSRKRFLNHESGIQEYVADLERLAADSKTDIRVFPLLTDFMNIKKTEGEINFEKAQRERDLAVNSLESSAAERISRSFRQLEESGIPAHDEQVRVYTDLMGELKASDPEYKSRYQDLVGFVRYLEMFKSFDPENLLAEVDGLSELLFGKLADGEDASEAVMISEWMDSIRKMIQLSATPDDISELETVFDSKEIEYLSGRLNRLILKLDKFYDKAQLADGLFQSIFEASKRFYSLTRQRDEAFVRNMSSKMAESGQKEAVLVAGGYHTPNLKSIFRKMGWSYAVVSPVVTHETDQKRYEKILLGNEGDGFGSVDQAMPRQIVQLKKMGNPIMFRSLVSELNAPAMSAARLSDSEDFVPPELNRTERVVRMIKMTALLIPAWIISMAVHLNPAAADSVKNAFDFTTTILVLPFIIAELGNIESYKSYFATASHIRNFFYAHFRRLIKYFEAPPVRYSDINDGMTATGSKKFPFNIIVQRHVMAHTYKIQVIPLEGADPLLKPFELYFKNRKTFSYKSTDAIISHVVQVLDDPERGIHYLLKDEAAEDLDMENYTEQVRLATGQRVIFDDPVQGEVWEQGDGEKPQAAEFYNQIAPAVASLTSQEEVQFQSAQKRIRRNALFFGGTILASLTAGMFFPPAFAGLLAAGYFGWKLHRSESESKTIISAMRESVTVKGSADTGSAEHPFYVKVENRSTAEGSEKYWVISVYSNDAKGGRYRYSKAIRMPSTSKDAPDETVIALWIHQAIYENSIQSSDFEEEGKYKSLDAFFDQVIERQILLPLGLADGEGYLSNVTRDSIAEYNSIRAERMKKVEHLRRAIRKERGINQEFGYTSALLDEIAEKEMLRIEAEERAEFQQAEQLGTEVSRLRSSLDRDGKVILPVEPEAAPKIQLSAEEKMAKRIKTRSVAEFFKWTAAAAVFGAAAGLILGLGFSTVLAGVPVLGAAVSVSAAITLLTALTRGYHLIGVLRGVSAERNSKPGSPLWSVTDGWGRTWVEASDAKPEDSDVYVSEESRQWTKRVLRNRSYQAMIAATEHAGDAEKRKAQFADFKHGALAGLAIILSVKVLAFFGVTALGIGAAAGLPIVAGVLVFGAGWALIHGFHRAVIEKVGSYDELFGTEKGFAFGLRTLANIVAGVPIHLIDSFFTRFLRHRIHFYWAGGRNKQWLSDEEIEAVISAGNEIGNRTEKTSVSSAFLRKTGLDRSRTGNILSEVYEASLLGGLVEFAKRRAAMAVFSVAFGFLMPVLFTSVAGFAVFTGTAFGFYSLLIATDSGLSARQKLMRIGAGALIFALIFAGGHWLGSSPPEWLIPDAAHRVPGFNLLDLGDVVTPGDLGIESLHSESFHFTVRSFVSSFPLAFSLGFAGKYTQTANLRAVRILNSGIIARLQLLNPASDPDLNLQEFMLREVSTDEILRWIQSVRHAAETGLLDAATASSLLRIMRHAVSDSADRIRIEISEQTVVLNRLDLLLRDYPDQTELITDASSSSGVFIENLRNLLFKTEFWIGVLFSSATMWFVSHEISALTHYARFIDMYLPVPVVSALVLAVEGDHDAQHKLALYQRSGADVSFFENLRSQGLLGSVNYAIVHLGGELVPQTFSDYLQNRETNRAKSLYEEAKTDEERLKSWHYLEFLKVNQDYQHAAAEYEASREAFLTAAQEHPDSAESDSLKSFRFVSGDRHDLTEAQVRQWLIDDYQVRTGDFSGAEPADLEVLADLSMRLIQLNRLKHAADVAAAKSSIYAGGPDLSEFNQFDAREFLFQASGVERDDLSSETIIGLAAVSERMLNEPGYSFEEAAEDAHAIILKAQKEKIRSEYADKTVRISSKLDQIRRLTAGLHGLQVPNPDLEGFDKLDERLKMDRNRESDQVDQRRINVLIADVQSLLNQMDNALIDARLLGEAEGSPLEDIMIPGMDLDDIKEAYLAKMLPSGASADPYNMHLFDYASAELLKNEPLVELFGADYMQQRIDKIRDGIIETEIGLRQNDLDGILSRLEEERLRLSSLEEQKRIAQGNGLIILSDGSVVEATDEDVKGMMRVGSLSPEERKLIPESLRGLSDDEFPDPDGVIDGSAEVSESTYVIARDTETGTEYVRIIPGVRSLEKYRQDMIYQSDAVKKMDLTHAYLAYRTSQAEYQSKNQIKDPEKYTTVSLFRVYSSDKTGAVEYRLTDAWMDSGQIITLDSLVNDPKYADKAKLLNIELADAASEFDKEDVELTLNGRPMILSRFQPVAVVQFKNSDGSYRYALAEARFNRQDWVKYTKNWEAANNYQSAHQRADQAKPVTGLLELRKEFLTAAIEEERSGVAELEGKEQELRSQLVTLKEQMVSLSVVSAKTEPAEEPADQVGLTEEEDPEWTDPETVEDYYMQMIQFKIQSFGEIIKSRADGLRSHAYAASEDETNRTLIEKLQEIEQKIEVFRVNGDIRDEDAAAFKASVNSMKQVFLYGILTHTDPEGSQFEESAAKMKSAAESMGLKDTDIQKIIDLKTNFYAQTKSFTEFDDSVAVEGRTAPQVLADLSGRVKNLQSVVAALELSASEIKDYDSAAADAVGRSLESFKIELERISIQIDELQKKGADESDLAHLTALADELHTIVEFSQKLLEQERSALEYGEALVQQNRQMDGSILENMIGITEQVVQQYGILHERLSLEADRQERFKYTATDEARAEVLLEQARIAGAFHRELAEAYISYHIPGSPVVSDADMEAAKEWAASVGIQESEFNIIADKIMNERRSDLRFKSADPSSDEAKQLVADIKYESLRKLLTLLYNKRGEVEYEMQMVLLERQREEMLHNADGQMKQNLVYWEVHAKNVGVLLAQADIQAVPWYRRKTKVATADKRTEAESVYLQEDLNMLSASISPRLPYDTMDGYDSAEAEARRIFQQYGGHLTNTNNLEPMLALRRGITEWYVRGKDIREERQLKSIDAMIQLMQIQERLSNIERYVLERLTVLESRDPAELTIRERSELARIRQKLADQQAQQDERKAALTQDSDRWSEEFQKIQRIAYEHHPGLELSALAHLTENEDLSAFSGDVLFQGAVRELREDEKQHLIRVSDLPFYERKQVEEAFVDAAGEKVKVNGDMYVVRLGGDNKGLYALVIGGDILDAKEKARVRLLQYELEVLKIWGKPSDDAKLGYSEAQNYYLWLKYTRFGWKPNLNSMLGSPYWQPMYGVEDGTLGAGKFSLHKNSEDFNQEKIVWNFWRYMQSLDLLGFVVEDEFADLSTSELHDVITASVPAVGDIRSVKDDKDAPVYAGNRVVGYRLRHHMLDNLTTIGRLLEVLNEEQRAAVLEKMNRQHLTLDSYVLPSEGGSFKVVRLGTLGASIRTSQINSELRNNLFFTVQEEDREDKQEQLNRRLTRAADDLEKAVFELEFISRELNQMQEFSNKNREDKNTEVERLELIRQQSTETITDKIEELKKGIQKPETSSLIRQLREQLKDVQIDYLMRLLPHNLETLGEEAERLKDRALHLGLTEDEYRSVVLHHRDRIREIDRWLEGRNDDLATKQKIRELLFKHPFDPDLTKAQSQFIQDFENRMALKRQVLNSRSMGVHYLPVLWQRQGVDGPWSKDRLDRLDRGPYAHIVDHIHDADGGLSHSEDGSYFERSVSHKDVPNGLYYRYHILDHKLQVLMRFHTLDELKEWIKEQPQYRGIDPEDIDLSAKNRFETELGKGDSAIYVQELSVMQIQDRFGNPKEIITHWTPGLHEEPHNAETFRLHPVPKMVFKVEVSAEEYQRIKNGGVYRASERYTPDALVGRSWGGDDFVEYDPVTKKYFVWRGTPRYNELVLETRVRNDDGTPGDKVEAGSERVSWGIALPIQAPVQIPYVRYEPRGYQVKRYEEITPFRGVTKVTYVMEAYTNPGETPIVHTFDNFLPTSNYLQHLAGYAEIIERPQYTGPVPLDYANRHLDNLSLSEQINMYGGVRINGKLHIGISDDEKEGLSSFLRKLIIDSKGEDLDAYYRALETNTWVDEDGSVHQLIYGFEDLDEQLNRIGDIVAWETGEKKEAERPRDIDEFTPGVEIDLQIQQWKHDVDSRFNETAHPRLLVRLESVLKIAEASGDKDAQKTVLRKIGSLRTTPDMIRPPKNLVLAIQILDRFASRTKDEELKREAEIAVLRAGVHPLMQVEKRDDGDFDRFKLVITYLDRHSNRSDSRDDRFGKWITYFEILIRNTETGEMRNFDTDAEKAYLPVILLRLNELTKPSGPLNRYEGPAKLKAVEVLEFLVKNLNQNAPDGSKPGDVQSGRTTAAGIRVPRPAPRGETPEYDSWQEVLKKFEATGHYPDEAELLELIRQDLKLLKDNLRTDPMQTDRNLNHVKTRIETWELGAMPKPARLADEQKSEQKNPGARLSGEQLPEDLQFFTQKAVAVNHDRWKQSAEGSALILPFVSGDDRFFISEITFNESGVLVRSEGGKTVFSADNDRLRSVRLGLLEDESVKARVADKERAARADSRTSEVRELTDAYVSAVESARQFIPLNQPVPDLAVVFDLSDVVDGSDTSELMKLRIDYLVMAAVRAMRFAGQRQENLAVVIQDGEQPVSSGIVNYLNAKIRQASSGNIRIMRSQNEIPEGFILTKASSSGIQTDATAINIGYQTSSNAVAFYEGVFYYAMTITSLTSGYIGPDGKVPWDKIGDEFVTDRLLQTVHNYTGLNPSSHEVYLALSARDKSVFMKLRLTAPKPFLNAAIAAARLAQRVIALSA